MPHITSPAQIKEIMKENDLIFHKGLGQNFLFDANYLEAIADSGEVTKEDTVIEVGPGLGVLTTRLAERAKKVIAVEIDQNLVPVLKKLTADFENVEIINEDIMKTDIDALVKEEKSVKVVANLPYYITTPIIMKLLEGKYNIKSITVMIQKEVAERFVAKPGTKDYGAITLSINYYTNPKITLTVPPSAFIPPPKVHSSVITLKCKEPEVEVNDEGKMFKIIKAAFNQRRKTLVNALSSGFSHISKDEIKNIITSLGYNENVRGETLALEDFAKISNIF